MLNYFRQNKIRHSILVGLLVIASIVKSNSLSCVCLLVAQFMFFIELFFIDTYFEKNKTHHLRIARKILISIGTTYIFIGVVMLLGYLYKLGHLNVFGNLFLGCGIITVFLFVIPLILKCVYKTTYYRLILTIRYIWQLFKAGAVVYAIFFISTICLSGVLLLVGNDFLSNSNPFLSSYVIVTYVICEFSALFLGYKYIKELPKQTLFYFRKARTILYLRSFEIDNSLLSEKCISEIEKFRRQYNYNFIKVGNPNSIFEIDSYYLPTTNWKYHVDKLIRSHKLIFVVLGKTPSLAWEVIKHEEYWPKYVFYVPDKAILDYWIKLMDHEGNKKLSTILNDIEIKNNGVAFYIENNVAFYSESIYHVVLAHEKGKYESNISYTKNDIGERLIKLSSEHTIYLYNQHKEVLATLSRINPYYLSLREYSNVIFYRQKFSRIYYLLPPTLSRQSLDKPVIPVYIQTRSLFRIYYFEYKYARLIFEPVLMFICTLGFNTPLFILSTILFIAILLMLIPTIFAIIPIEILTSLKNKFKFK